jgi:hypothetical protein
MKSTPGGNKKTNLKFQQHNSRVWGGQMGLISILCDELLAEIEAKR